MDFPILAQSDFQIDSGRRLRKVIAMLGISQVEAARIMGISKHVLRNWLTGDDPIKPYAIYRLYRSRGVDLNYIFLGDWQRLPHALARELEDDLQARLEAAPEAALPEDETPA
jgi:transcriptional regulator with XRE-family HTH domain